MRQGFFNTKCEPQRMAELAPGSVESFADMFPCRQQTFFLHMGDKI
jgi:hypothetical protein